MAISKEEKEEKEEMKMTEEKGKRNSRILALVILSIGVLILASSLLLPITIISVSKIEIRPEGYVDENNEVRESFWVVTMVTTCTDKAVAWKFCNESDRYKYYKGEEVSLASELEIIIDPEPPYWTRPLEVHSHQVYPQTYGFATDIWGKREKTSDVIPSLSVNSYQFGARSDVPNVWTIHTPFWITLKKNGVELDKQYMDTIGIVETIKLVNPSDPENEYIVVENLGKIGTRYGQPSVTNILCIEKQLGYIFSGSDQVENKINYDAVDLSYSNYWFGGGKYYTGSQGWIVERWSDDGSPAHHIVDYASPWKTPFVVKDEAFPGNARYDQYKAYPIKADIWQDNPNTNPYGKSLVNYLKRYHNTLDVDAWKCGAEITDDNFLKVNVPFASESSVITVRISTELADTVVWRPQISNVQFVSCEWETGGTDADIQDRLNAVLTVKQHSSVKSTATIKPILETLGQPVTINPAAHTVDLVPNDETTVKFEFLNLGTAQDQPRNIITFVIENTLGDETDRASLTFVLKAKGVAETILTVYTIDAETEMGVGGIPVTITYDSSTQLGYTIDGTVVFDLEGVEGQVPVESSETLVYQSASDVATVKAGEPNKVTLRLYKKGVIPPPPPDYTWFLIILSVAIGTAIVLLTYKTRKKEEK